MQDVITPSTLGGPHDGSALSVAIIEWGRALGFQEVGIAGTDLAADEIRLMNWLRANRHGEMDYMARHGNRRARPADLVPGTLRVISARMNYWPGRASEAQSILSDSRRAYIARYALGRDYHKVMRARLEKLARRIRDAVGEFAFRVFTDSAPVLEVALAAKAGLGWRGNRVCGCDDGALVCPWTRDAPATTAEDFARVRNGLDDADLVTLFAWTEAEFNAKMEGSAIRRIGYERWSRNLAVGLGNAEADPAIVEALRARADDPSPLVREHVAWALAQQASRAVGAGR